MYDIFSYVHLFDYNAERQQNGIGHSNLRCAKFMQKQHIEDLNPWPYKYIYPRSPYPLLPHQQLTTMLCYQKLWKKLLTNISLFLTSVQ